MSNYVNNISVYGLMNKNCFINNSSEKLSFFKTKNKKNVVFFEMVDDISEYNQVFYMYLDNEPKNIKGAYSSNQITSILRRELFEDMPGKKYREIRESVNKYKNIIKVNDITTYNIDSILSMIEEWRYMNNGGMKYGWQEHAGIDKSIVNRYVNGELKGVLGYSFWYCNKCIGYSIIEKNHSDVIDGYNEFKYLTRKVLNTKRNITEYVDWYTFKTLYDKYKYNNFLINWGCSSGGVHWYKTHKWELYREEKKWFCKISNKLNDENK